MLSETARLLLAEMIKEDFPSETISTENPEFSAKFQQESQKWKSGNRF
ncbi:hypothetical protein CUZ93_2419 [Enterococcus xinjiangensis]|nr:hypothetical protein EfmE1636_2849 [Enterococcus faecium E1636]MBL4995750.1 hypothetical protein [Enterococcus lactis]MBL5001272.1 hypothetical protein [Enterococcus lactis]